MTETAKTPRAKPAAEKTTSDGLCLKTSGPFMLVDPYSGAEFTEKASKDVVDTPFVRERVQNGDLVDA